MTSRLRITEIFHSLQGETTTVGIPTVFVRLTGCPLRCQYCDTAYAFEGGEWMNVDAILDQVAEYKTRYVTVTGGEPLAQKVCLELLTRLCDSEHRVSLETSGSIDISGVDERVIRIVDFKTPGSGMLDHNLFDNVAVLTATDEVKFVICDRADYDWARGIIDQYKLTDRCDVLLSPSYEQLEAGELADWMLADQLPVRLQIQLHKYLWGNEPGR